MLYFIHHISLKIMLEDSIGRFLGKILIKVCDMDLTLVSSKFEPL